jgi:DNA-binding MarR family transcriptional regulator
MDNTTSLTEQKLFRALAQFRRLGWYQHSIAGCKPSEIRVLFCIKRMSQPNAELKVSEISKQLLVTPPTVTQLLNGLEANGLIERRSDAADRRSVGVRLTSKGELVTQQAADAHSALLSGLMEYLGEEQSNQLADLLSKAFHYFNEKEVTLAHEQWSGMEET